MSSLDVTSIKVHQVAASEPLKKNNAYKCEPGVHSQLFSCSIRPVDF